MRIVSPTVRCKSTETAKHWSIKGPQGPQGIQGEQGEKGEQGDKGDKGDTGASGVVVPNADRIGRPVLAVQPFPAGTTVVPIAGLNWELVASGPAIVWNPLEATKEIDGISERVLQAVTLGTTLSTKPKIELVKPGGA